MLLFSEGRTDVGDDDDEGRRGAVRELTRRSVSAHFNRDVAPSEIVVERLPRLHAAGYARKVVAGISLAAERRKTCVAFVVDRDRTPGEQRLQQLADGRRAAEAMFDVAGLARSTALGVAVECLEAWLLADEAALARALGAPVPGLPDPETLDGKPETPDHPKEHLRAVLERASFKGTTGEAIEKIAPEIDPAVLRRRCPSFAKYADELKRAV